MVVVCLAGCAMSGVPTSPSQQLGPEFLQNVCPSRFSIERDGEALELPVCSTRALDLAGAGIRRIVLVIHGDARNGPDYFRWTVEAAAAAGVTDALIVAPNFVTDKEVDEENLGDNVLHWSDEGWKEGNMSRREPGSQSWQISSFEALDALLESLLDGGDFPDLQDVVIIGHSAGGQFANRYAAGSAAADDPRIRFIVANPSSYLYLDGLRYDPDSRQFREPDADECRRYDRYKYGLDSRNQYMSRSSADEIRQRFRDRQVTYLLGTEDTNDDDSSLDTSCAGRAQGPNRLERGLRYYAYLGEFYGDDVYRTQALIEIPDIGHDGEKMLASAWTRPTLFPALDD